MDKKYIIFGVILILIILSIVLYIKLSSDIDHEVIMYDYDLFYNNKQRLISNEVFKESLVGNKYSISFWIKTANISTNAAWDTTTKTSKTIIFKEGSPNVLFIFPNTIRIEIGYKDSEGSLVYYNFDFELYDSQRWNNFVIVVNNFFGYLGFIDYYNDSITRTQIEELYDKRINNLPKYLMNYKQYLEKDTNESSNILNLINK